MANTGSMGGAAAPAYGSQQPGGAESPEEQANRDRSFVKKALESGSAEVKLGELAQQSSQSEDIKQFVRKMAEEHKQLEGQIEPIAAQIGVVPPTELSRKDKKVISKLEGLSGPKFDEEYISAVLKGHQQDLKDFNSEAEKTQNAALRDAAKEGAAVISQHLQQIQTIVQSHNVTSSR